MIVAKFLLVLYKIAFMELNPSHMVLDQDVNDQEKGTIVDHEKRVGAINPVVEIVMMIITEREAGNERDTVIVTETVTESVTESESIVIVRS
jgi:NADH dehydrogenase/NADH:ubiquinone oxidoreductase subunit G